MSKIIEVGGVFSSMNQRTKLRFFIANAIQNKLPPTPTIPEPVAFGTDSWATIQKAVKDGNTSKYHVGDTKEIKITGYTNTSEKPTFTVRIANMATPAECGQDGFSQTACGFVVEFVDIITKHIVNPQTPEAYYGTNKGGFPKTKLYQFLNNETNSIYSALPDDLKSIIINTYTVSSHGSADSADGKGANFISNNKLYLLTLMEIYGADQNGLDTSSAVTKQLEYYKINNVTEASNLSKVIKNYKGSPAYWWLRAAHIRADDCFLDVKKDGGSYNGPASFEYGVAPAFRIG